MDGYEVKLYYSPEDECYVAQIVEFIGCATDGPTPEEALANLRLAKADWMRIVTENGYPVPPPRHVPPAAPLETKEAPELVAA